MSKIFISYRRDDSEAYAGRLFDRLSARFGEGQIFMDVDTEPGSDFVEVIEDEMGSCDVLISVIGRNWLAVTDSDGRPRLDDPSDFVRLENAAALDREIPVIPVLVGGATMPQAAALPDVLSSLARRQAIEITHTRFHNDVDRLVVALERILSGEKPESVLSEASGQSEDSLDVEIGSPSVTWEWECISDPAGEDWYDLHIDCCAVVTVKPGSPIRIRRAEIAIPGVWKKEQAFDESPDANSSVAISIQEVCLSTYSIKDAEEKLPILHRSPSYALLSCWDQHGEVYKKAFILPALPRS